jgi:hypothetical protein
VGALRLPESRHGNRDEREGEQWNANESPEQNLPKSVERLRDWKRREVNQMPEKERTVSEL